MNNLHGQRSVGGQQQGDALSSLGLVLLVGVDRQQCDVGAFDSVQTNRLERAIEVLENAAVTIVVSALDLTDSTGISTLQRLRRAAGSVPVVVALDDGRNDGETVRRVLAEGAAGYFPLPAADPSLLEAFLRTLHARQIRGEEFRIRADRVARAVEGSGDGLWDWDVADGGVFFSPRCSTLLGLGEQESLIQPDTWFDKVHPEDRQVLKRRLQAVVEGGSAVFSCEHRILNGFGEPHWVRVRGKAVRDHMGRVTGVAGFLSDVTDRRRTEQEAIHRSLHDGLTGLANRSLFMDRVSRALAALNRRDGGHFAILFVDLDYFKTINDLHGHSAGDAVLLEVGRRLESLLRLGDTVGRIGGDEFGIMLANVDEAAAAGHVADRVIELLSDPIMVGRNELVISASVGITISSTGYADAAEMIHNADLAMYRAKSLGRARTQFCDPEMHAAAIARLRLEAELQEAVAERRFEMHYQPVIDLDHGRIAGVEAMFRWRHPEVGLLTPSEFIDVAERTGVIIQIGWWVIREACRQISDWQRRLPTSVLPQLCVNVSPKIILQDRFVDFLGDVLRQAQVPPRLFVLEVTEDLVLNHGDRAIEVLDHLRSRGIRLCLDDFGAGFASLSHLDRIHYDLLKIDPSVVVRINGRDTEDRLPETVLGLARHMGIEAVAEGVETRDQARGLRAIGCRLAQGHWFSRPSLPDEVEDLINSPPEWWVENTDSGE